MSDIYSVKISSYRNIHERTVSILSKINYSADMALFASCQATVRNIADSAGTSPQPISNPMRNDAAVV